MLAVLLAGPGLPAQAPAAVGEAGAPAPPAAVSKIDSRVLAQLAGGGQSDFLVVLGDQADLSGAAGLASKIEKGRYVYHTLLKKAQGTQRPLIAWLQAQHVEYRAFYIVNMVWVAGGLSLAQALAARADVARIDANPLMKGVESTSAATQAPAPAGIEPNVTYVHADQLWALGFTGQGIVIGSGDTGIQWDHPALKPHYRGWNGAAADHNFNWHDSIHTGGGSCGHDAVAPCDDLHHGTHTMGTAVGDDGGSNQIGVAPGAKWIGCRNMDQGNGTPARYIECFQFFLAPYPITGTVSDGNPDLAPDVTTNSWTCPISEGCTTGNELLAAIQAQQAAGIMTVVAAGNYGPSCSTVREAPSIYGEAYTVGALNTGSDTIASFSSRGPVTIDGSNRRKPDITAPGTNVRSSIPINIYSNQFSGTSMATPHVAGAAALLWSAVPGLRGQITLTEQILNDSAVHLASTDCGSSGWPNNTFGYGRLDVKAALDHATALFGGVISGTISRANQGTPVAGAAVSVSHGQLVYATTSGLTGDYGLSVLTGTYTLTASAFGYLPRTLGNISVLSGITTTVPITLTPAVLNFLPLIAH
jgi:serine protease AprX